MSTDNYSWTCFSPARGTRPLVERRPSAHDSLIHTVPGTPIVEWYVRSTHAHRESGRKAHVKRLRNSHLREKVQQQLVSVVRTSAISDGSEHNTGQLTARPWHVLAQIAHLPCIAVSKFTASNHGRACRCLRYTQDSRTFAYAGDRYHVAHS